MPNSAVTAFEYIVYNQGVREMGAFLLQLEKADLIPVRLRTKQLYRDLNNWDANKPQLAREKEVLLFLAGLATYSRQEALGRSFDLPWNFNNENPKDLKANKAVLLDVLRHSRPTWLTDMLVRMTRNNPWSTIEYGLLRELAAENLVDYDPWLFAQSLAQLLQRYNRNHDGHSKDFGVHVLRQLQANTTLLERDVLLFFDFDTSADSAAIYGGKNHETITWLMLLTQLVASGHLERGDLLTRCLLALRRDFRRPLLTWFKNVFLALKPSRADCLARQGELVELLAHPLPQVVNFAIEQCKELWAEPGFEVAPLLLYAEALMTRQDLKTGIKTLLGGFGKFLKANQTLAPALRLSVGTPAPIGVLQTDEGLAPALARLYTAALAHADAAVQERAAKGLVELLGAKKPLLSPVEIASTTATLGLYADLLGPATRQVLAPWLTAPTAAGAALATPETYAPRLDFVPDISPTTAIAPVADWHELLFLTGPVLQHDDPAATERWLDGLLRLRPQFPDNYAELLQPYVQQVLPYLKGKTESERAAVLQNPTLLAEGHTGLVQALLVGWATGFAAPLVPQVVIQSTYRKSDPLVTVDQQRLAFLEILLVTQQALPLLSTPTHAPHWVAPTTLVHKLLAYQAAGSEPNPADLTLALARTACQHPAEAAAALALLPQLQHQGLRELLTWFLSAATAPLPAAVARLKPLRPAAPERLSQRLNQRLLASLAEALPALWAVAARTKHPSATLPDLAHLTAQNCPGVVQPWQPRWELDPNSHTYVNQYLPGKPEIVTNWVELHLLPEPAKAPAPSTLLLYSQHATLALPTDKAQHYRSHNWQYLSPLATDFPFLMALLPQCPAPLYWHALNLTAFRDLADSSVRGALSEVLRSLLGPGPGFGEAAAVLLAVGLTNNATGCRALALEVLLAAVPTGRLLPAALGQALSQLLAIEFVPIQRLADNLAQARAIDAPTDDALRQTLDALLPELPAEPLRNTRKLLEAYADLLARTQQPAPEPVQARLRLWLAAPSLKKIATALMT